MFAGRVATAPGGSFNGEFAPVLSETMNTYSKDPTGSRCVCVCAGVLVVPSRFVVWGTVVEEGLGKDTVPTAQSLTPAAKFIRPCAYRHMPRGMIWICIDSTPNIDVYSYTDAVS